jgi:hypothetical protein
MIGVAEHDVGAGIPHLAPVHAFHGAGGADRHEGRRLHHAMGRRQPAGSRRAVGCEQLEVIGYTHLSRLLRHKGRLFNRELRNFRAKDVDQSPSLAHKSAPMTNATTKTTTKTKPSGGSGGVRA